jgi:ATP-dependent exoDNAse (exonuclease V) beta subunit
MSYSHMPHDKSAVGVLLPMLCNNIEKKADRKEGTIYESGNANWHMDLPSTESNVDSGIDLTKVHQYYSQDASNRPARQLSRAAKSMRGLSRVLPSMLEGGNRVRLSETLTSPDRERTQEFGRLMHACFEKIHWLDQGEPISDLALQQALQICSPGSNQINEVIKQFRELLEEDNLYNLLTSTSSCEHHVVPNLVVTNEPSESNRLEVHTEKRLAVLMRELGQHESESETDSLIEGVVDRLVLVFENGAPIAAEIIDFKVDQIDGMNLTDRVQHYRPQLAAYKSAIGQMLRLSADRIASRLVFVRTGQIVQVDSLDHSVDGTMDLKLPRRKKRSASKQKAKPKPPKSAKSKPKQAGSEFQQTLWSDNED